MAKKRRKQKLSTPLLIAIGVGLYLLTREKKTVIVDQGQPTSPTKLPTYPTREAGSIQRILPRRTVLYV